MTRLAKVILFILILSILITACQPKRLDYSFPPSGAVCPTTITWKNLQPGISSKRDVINVLGKPDGRGRRIFYDDKSISFFAYTPEGGDISEFVQHRIFFRSDNTIDWIEVIVADQDGQFHSVKETTDQLGDSLDAVYENSDYNPFAEFQYDILAGPDQIYVWSECGIAIIAMISLKKLGPNKIEFTDVNYYDPWILTLRYPDQMPSTLPVSDLDSVVMMKFLFPPTTFEDYMENYRHRIPYGLWDEYLDTVELK